MRALALAATALALAAPLMAGDDLASALEAARERFPGTDVRGVAPTPIPDLYEFDMGGEAVYGDAGARFLILGRLVDTDGLGERKADYPAAARVGFTLQEGAEGELVLFSDPHCPYCRVFEQRLVAGELEGWSVKVVMLDTTGGPEHVRDWILCSNDPGLAYRSFVLDGVQPAYCEGDGRRLHEGAAAAAGVSATPSFLAPSGAVLSGLPDPAALLEWAKAGQR